jgi:hypothetical protein
MANEDIIRRAPLAPPNSPTIAAADRSRVYDLIGRELNGALNGEASVHPDGMKKGPADLMFNLDGLSPHVLRRRNDSLFSAGGTADGG